MVDDTVRHPLTRFLSLQSPTVAALSAARLEPGPIEPPAEWTVFAALTTCVTALGRLDRRSFDFASPEADLIVVGSPRFNPVAEEIQHYFNLPCSYVSARATGDAAARDLSPTLSRSERVLRIVTVQGDEFGASVDNGLEGAGTDYGLVLLGTLRRGRRLIWISGIHGRGTLGAYLCLTQHAGALASAYESTAGHPDTALIQVVRVTYDADAVEARFAGIHAEPLGAGQLAGVRFEDRRDRAVLFDLGDVIMKFDRDRAYRAIARVKGCGFTDVRDAIRDEDRRSRLLSRYDLGEITTGEFLERLAAALGAGERLRERLPEFWGDIFWPNYEMFEILRHLNRVGVRLGLVSNTNALHFGHIEGSFPEIIRLFATRSLSCEVGAAKPDRAIFEDGISRMAALGVDRSALLYVDDLRSYVTRMRDLGVEGFVYRSHSHFIGWLRAAGLYIPTIVEDWTEPARSA